jgi:hypothetical protein
VIWTLKGWLQCTTWKHTSIGGWGPRNRGFLQLPKTCIAAVDRPVVSSAKATTRVGLLPWRPARDPPRPRRPPPPRQRLRPLHLTSSLADPSPTSSSKAGRGYGAFAAGERCVRQGAVASRSGGDRPPPSPVSAPSYFLPASSLSLSLQILQIRRGEGAGSLPALWWPRRPLVVSSSQRRIPLPWHQSFAAASSPAARRPDILPLQGFGLPGVGVPLLPLRRAGAREPVADVEGMQVVQRSADCPVSSTEQNCRGCMWSVYLQLRSISRSAMPPAWDARSPGGLILLLYYN